MTSTKDAAEPNSTMTFPHYRAIGRLKKLAISPLDLSVPGNFSPERIEKYCAEACGYSLLYGTERVTDEVMQALVELAQEATVLDKMHRMQSGEVLNFIRGYPSENRAVLHTATRDFFGAPHQGATASEAAQIARHEYDKLKEFIYRVEAENRFTNMIMIGIGGSDLGPYANFLGMEYVKKHDRNIYFINNIDPDNTAMVLQDIDLEKTLVVVVSKSGTTLETIANAEFVKRRFVSLGLDPKEHFISVTGEGSPMDNPDHYLSSFYIWDWVGGRFSSTSMVGGVLLAFACGFDAYAEFLRGANAMDKAALSSDIDSNLPLLAALLEIWNRNLLGYQTLAIIPYSYALRRFPAHIQQVEMESNGKRIDRSGARIDYSTGPVIWGEPGTNGQHSFFQLIHQGTDIIPVEFIGFKESQCHDDILYNGTTSQEKLLSNLFAQMIALAVGKESTNPNKEFPGNRPSHLLIASKLTPFALGALLSFYEHKVAFEGFIWNVNSFDQAGVQLGKVTADNIIDLFAGKRGEGKREHYPLGEAFINHLETL